MSLFTMVHVAANSMATQRTKSSVIAHNLENVNTPGYSRQRADLRSVMSGRRVGGALLGDGSRVAYVAQVRDTFTEAQIPKYQGDSGFGAGLSHVLKAVSIFDPNEPGNVVEAVADYFQHLRELAQNPGDTALRTTVVGAGKQMASAFNLAWESLEEHRNGIDYTINLEMNRVNELADRVANLNRQIKNALDAGAYPNDLMDERLIARDELSELTGATAYNSGDGTLNMAFPNGQTLVNGLESARFETIPDPNNDGHLSIRYYKTDGAGPYDLPYEAMKGRLGGYLEARDGILAGAQSQLDALAFDVGTQINNVHFYGAGKNASTHNKFFDNVGVMVNSAYPESAGVKGVDISASNHTSINLAQQDVVTLDGVSLTIDWTGLTGAEQAVLTGDYSVTPMTDPEKQAMADAVKRLINDAVAAHNVANPGANLNNAEVTLGADGMLTINSTSSGSDSSFDVSFGGNNSVMAQLLVDNATTGAVDVSDLSQDTLSDALIKDAVTVSSNSFDFRRAAKYIAMNLDLDENKDLIATADYGNISDDDGDGIFDSTPNGDATALFEMLEVQNLDLTNVGNTTNGGLNDMITGFGVEVNAAEALQYSADLSLNHLKNLRESISGVSIDEELVELEASQRAYQGIAKVITTSDQMMDTLMRIK